MEYRNIRRIQVDFINRDGVPTAFVMDTDDVEDMALQVDVHTDGLHADIGVWGQSIINDGKSWRFTSLENLEEVGDGRVSHPPAELGRVAKVVISTVALAILVPFIGILWAWASNVVRAIGGFW